MRTTKHYFIQSNPFLRFLHLHSQEKDIPRVEKGNTDVRRHQLDGGQEVIATKHF